MTYRMNPRRTSKLSWRLSPRIGLTRLNFHFHTGLNLTKTRRENDEGYSFIFLLRVRARLPGVHWFIEWLRSPVFYPSNSQHAHFAREICVVDFYKRTWSGRRKLSSLSSGVRAESVRVVGSADTNTSLSQSSVLYAEAIHAGIG